MSDNRKWGNNLQQINQAGFREGGVQKGAQAARDQRPQEIGKRDGGAFAQHQAAGAKNDMSEIKRK